MCHEDKVNCLVSCQILLSFAVGGIKNAKQPCNQYYTVYVIIITTWKDRSLKKQTSFAKGKMQHGKYFAIIVR